MTSRLSSNNKKKRILFVDDEPDLTSLIKKALESAGFSVNVFNNSADALREKFPTLDTECLIPKPIQINELVKRIETELLR